jgi:GntR family transcriptional regulator
VTRSISVDLADPTPPFEQLRRQIATLIETGQLAPGERLPPVRQLARDLGIAPGTVARAVQELEQAGLVQTRRGGGTTVAPIALSPSRMTRARLDAAATTFVASVRTLGLTQEDAHEAVARAWT